MPPHNDHARQNAVEIYQNHRLELAKQNQDYQLISFAIENFNCAKTNQGDYKLSCDRYEDLLRKTGFTFTKQQITSSIYEQQGGMFIYKAWLEQYPRHRLNS